MLSRLLLVTMVFAALAGCTGGAAPGGPAGRSQTPSESGGGGEALRVDLERALGRFTLLGSEALQATAAGDEDAAGLRRWWRSAAADVHDVAAAVDPAAAVFGQPWEAVSELLVEDAQSLGATQTQRIDDELDHAVAELGTAVGTGDEWDSSAATDAWEHHVEALRNYVRAHDDGEHEAALTLAREEHARMVELAHRWAQGLAQRHDLGDAGSGRIELRSALNQLFGEHAVLMAMTVRQVRDQRPPAEATAAALNGNSEDIRRALTAVLDAPTAERIDALWRRQIDLLLRRTLAARQGDGAGDLASGLADTSEDLVDELSAAVDDLDGEQVQAALGDLHAAIGAYGRALERDRLPRAGEEATAAHSAATRIADLVAAAIARTRPEDFPAS